MRRGSRGLNLDYRALYERYLAGESGTALAAEAGIHYSGLYVSWKRRGWPMRSQTDAALLLHQQRPELGSSIVVAQAARRGRTDPMARREQRAQTREARGLGISHHEERLGNELRALGIPFRQQVAFGPYNADFTFDHLRLVLEIDGGGHNPRVRAMKAARTDYIESYGWRVVRLQTRRKGWFEEALALVT